MFLRPGRLPNFGAVGSIGVICLFAIPSASAQTQATASDQATLIAAIEQVSIDFARGDDNGPYVIDVTEDITLSRTLPSIRTFLPGGPGGSGPALTINGNSHLINANNAGRVFVIAQGRVAIANLHIANARAQGGHGGDQVEGGGGGGGLGAGAAILVNAGADVSVTSVVVENAVAVGGNGGSPRSVGATSVQGGGGGGGLNGTAGTSRGRRPTPMAAEAREAAAIWAPARRSTPTSGPPAGAEAEAAASRPRAEGRPMSGPGAAAATKEQEAAPPTPAGAGAARPSITRARRRRRLRRWRRRWRSGL